MRNQTKRGGLRLTLGLLFSTFGATLAGAATMFTVQLDSSQEVFPGGQSALSLVGSGTLALTQDGSNHLSFNLVFEDGIDFGDFVTNTIPPAVGSGIDPETASVAALHIHNAARGANGGIVFGILSPSSDLDGDTQVLASSLGTSVLGEWDSGEGNNADLDDFVAALLAAQPGEELDLYFNLHTSDDPAGAIRGQIVAVPEVTPAWGIALGLGALAALRRRNAA